MCIITVTCAVIVFIVVFIAAITRGITQVGGGSPEGLATINTDEDESLRANYVRPMVFRSSFRPLYHPLRQSDLPATLGVNLWGPGFDSPSWARRCISHAPVCLYLAALWRWGMSTWGHLGTPGKRVMGCSVRCGSLIVGYLGKERWGKGKVGFICYFFFV